MSEESRKIRIADDLGDELTLAVTPQRIVSLVPSITETLIEMGAAKKVVGITNYCVHPKEVVTEIAKVGGTKGLAIEQIDRLRPDLVIANKEENLKREVDAIRERHPVFVTYPRTVEQAMKTVLDLGVLANRTSRASEIAETCDRLISSTHPVVRGNPLRTVCLVWRDPWITAGPDSYVSDLLDTFGFRNVFSSDGGRYPKTSLEAIIGHRPDVIILPSEPYEFKDKDKAYIESLLTKGGHKTRVLLLEGSHLTWFGYRTILGVKTLRATKANLLSDKD